MLLTLGLLLAAVILVFVLAWAAGCFATPEDGQPSYRPENGGQRKASEMVKWDLCIGRKGWAQRRSTLP